MKIQDIGFLLILVVTLAIKSPRFSVGLGIFCLLLSMPLFAKWVFFTAERLAWYAAAFFLLAIFQLLKSRSHDRN